MPILTHLDLGPPSTVLAAASGFALLVSFILWRYSQLRGIPGPWLAQISRLWHVSHILRGDQADQLIALHEKHGKFVRIAHNEVSVNHPDAIKKIMLAPLHKSNWYSIVAFPDSRYQNPFSTTDPKLKLQRSKNLAPGLTLSSLLSNESAVDTLIAQLKTYMDSHAQSHTPMHLDEFFTYTTFDIVGEILFSKPFGFLREANDIAGSIRNSFFQSAYVTVMGFFPLLHKLAVNRYTTTTTTTTGTVVGGGSSILPFGHIVDTTMDAVRDREQNPDTRADVLSHWFKALREHPDRMSLFELHSAATNMVAAGADTVACGLQSFVYHMIRHPDAWERVRQEVLASGSHVVDAEVVAYADAQGMPYLQACIREALRVFGPGSGSLARVVPQGGLQVGDRILPEGMIVSVSPWVMHASKEIWGPDAREFNPDRWLGEDASRLERFYMPFGLGYASCPGKNLANIDLSKICATLVRDYDFEQVDKGAKWKYYTFFSVAPYGWPVYMRRRGMSQE